MELEQPIKKAPRIIEDDEDDEDDEVQQEPVNPESPDIPEHTNQDPESPPAEHERQDPESPSSDANQEQNEESSDDELEALKIIKKTKKTLNSEDEDEDEDEGDASSKSSSSSSSSSSGKVKGVKKSKLKRTKNNSDSEEDDSDDGEDDDDDDDTNEESKKKKSADKKTDGEEEEEDEDDKGQEEEEEEDDDDDDERANRRPPNRTETLYDFDIMMAKKKEENSRKRRRRNYDIINDNDDIIADIINQMKDAVEADSEANKNKMAATKKLKLLPFVISQLRKVDLRDAFLDSDVLSVMTEWLAPLPDKSLPHLNIRENLLKILIDFNLYDVDRIKGSGIGKAIMYLYKHPKETRENKQRAKQLISCWSRPIFQLDSSFNSISREEREQRDLELMNKQRRASRQNDSSDGEGAGPSSSLKKTPQELAQKPGDKGWIPRARVPAPSMKDYVIRPRSKVDGEVGKSSKRPSNMLEKYMKNQQERRRANRQQRAINMKIDRV